jgi:hypothetical protein
MMVEPVAGSNEHPAALAGDEDRYAPSESGLEREFAHARERLAFYEGFDRLIQENISRSGDLLREAAEQREAAARDIAQARAQLERRVAQQRATLTLIGEELVGLQERAGGLARRVIAALDDLTDAQTSPAVAAVADEPVTAPGADAVEATEELASGPMVLTVADDAGPIPSASELPGTGSDDPPATFASAPSVADRPVGTSSYAADPHPVFGATVAVEDGGIPVETGPKSVAVVVHGIPRAAAALSLQRHLHDLAHVDAVEAREYAAGVLRLQVSAHGPLALDDLRGWEGGAGLEPVNVLANVIEVKLPGAAGF